MPTETAARNRFEPDDLAPTRLRWQSPSQSQLEVTRVQNDLPSVTRVQPLRTPPTSAPPESEIRLTETAPPPKSWRDLSEPCASAASIELCIEAQPWRPWLVAALTFAFTLAVVLGFFGRLAWLYL